MVSISTPSFATYFTARKIGIFFLLTIVSNSILIIVKINPATTSTNPLSRALLTCAGVHLRFQTLHKISETPLRLLLTLCPEISERFSTGNYYLGRVLLGSTISGWLGWLSCFVFYWQKTIFSWFGCSTFSTRTKLG